MTFTGWGLADCNRGTKVSSDCEFLQGSLRSTKATGEPGGIRRPRHAAHGFTDAEVGAKKADKVQPEPEMAAGQRGVPRTGPVGEIKQDFAASLDALDAQPAVCRIGFARAEAVPNPVTRPSQANMLLLTTPVICKERM